MAGDVSRVNRHESIARQTGSVDEGGAYTEDEIRFLKAVEEFKRRGKVRFPTAVDLLRVAVSIGYRLEGSIEQVVGQS